jgi:hypothetical protein
MKRQSTEWIWVQKYAEGNFLRVGFIHNKNRGIPLDRIKVQIHGKNTDLDFNMRLDEASGLAAGINKVICALSLRGSIIINEKTT